jgi:hypothetical protein
MKFKKPTTIKVQRGEDENELVSVILMAFHPNLSSGKNRGFAIVPNDGTLLPNEKTIRADETGKYLYVNEMALPFSTRLALHTQSREMKGKPLIFDERVTPVKFVWE